MFSDRLEKWLKSDGTKTVGDLEVVFGERSFAILFLLFMFIPALPISTGGITHVVLLPIVMLSALQMIFGRRILWLPNWATKRKLGSAVMEKGLPFMMRRIRWFEKYSRPRLAKQLDAAWLRTLAGVLVFILAVAAFIAPPFSGLDTLPSMGAVIIALSLVLEDIVLFVAGALVGAIGIGLIIATAGAITAFLQHFL